MAINLKRSEDQEFRNPLIFYGEAKNIDLNRVLLNLFMLIKYNGVRPKTKIGRKHVTTDTLVKYLLRRESEGDIEGFSDYPEAVSWWVMSNLTDLVNRDNPEKEALASLKAIHLDSYMFRNPHHARDYNISEQVFTMLQEEPELIGKLKHFLEQGWDHFTNSIAQNSGIDLDTLGILKIVEQINDDPSKDAHFRPIKSLCPGQARIFCDDVRRLLIYQQVVPRHVLLDYLKTLIGIHVGLYLFKLFRLLPDWIAQGERHSACRQCPVSTYNEQPFAKCPYHPEFVVDCGDDPGVGIAQLAEEHATFWYARIYDYVRATEISATKLIELRNLAEHSHVLLVLIPSNLRTAAEDSFDRSTFKQLEIDSLQQRIIQRLEDQIPAQYKSYYNRILAALRANGICLRPYKHAEYLLNCDDTSVLWGRNLYLFGLIPDDILLDEPNLLEQRLYQNYLAVQCLQDEREPLIRRIFSLAVKLNNIQKSLFSFLTNYGAPENASAWGQLIARNEEYASLNLRYWEFTDLQSIEQLELFVHPLKGKSVLKHQEGFKQIVTKFAKSPKVSMKFETSPAPSQVNELTHFRIELMRTNEDGELETVCTLLKFKKTAGKGATRSKQVALKPGTIDEGVYFFRVLALDNAGTVLNRSDRFRERELQELWQQRRKEGGEQSSRHDLQGKLTCDSEDFYFVVGGEEDIPEPGESRRAKATNLLQALIKARLDYVRDSSSNHPDSLKISERFWTDGGKGGKRECELEVRFNDVRHRYVVPLAVSLRELSWQMLKAADKLGMFRIDFVNGPKIEQGQPHLRDNGLHHAAPEYFLSARKTLFEAILAQIDESDEPVAGLVETCDFFAIAEEIETYLAAYQQWSEELHAQTNDQIDKEVLETITGLQLLDHVELVLPGVRGRRDYALMLTPLHPFRIAWYLQQQRLYGKWEEQILEASNVKQLWQEEVQNVFAGGLLPHMHPIVIHGQRIRSDGSSFYYVGEIAPGWGIYVPVSILSSSTETSTSRALLGQVQDLLGIPVYLREEADFPVKSLYCHLRRYLLQHPYVEVLHLNVFNPGSGEKIIKCLKRLQQEQVFADLRYEIRLFAPLERLNEAGRAFEEFLQPSGHISYEADDFIVPTINPLFPKLRFSRNSIAEYQDSPELYQAHISVMLDMFPVDVRLLRETTLREECSVFCHALVIDPINQSYQPGEDSFGWHHYLALNETPPMSENDQLTEMLTHGLRTLQQLIAITLAGASGLKIFRRSR